MNNTQKGTDVNVQYLGWGGKPVASRHADTGLDLTSRGDGPSDDARSGTADARGGRTYRSEQTRPRGGMLSKRRYCAVHGAPARPRDQKDMLIMGYPVDTVRESCDGLRE
jgi:hypothetical protein